ncbi:MAG: DEAD/DEAH box helicase [Verrucomicrobiae bacterium]|nr:DEAD/DEAH box helicase [Verrucomicrobiae bacterium]
MARTSKKGGRAPRYSAGTAKYDAHHRVLEQTYGALADLRRELTDSKERVAERREILELFSRCNDSQRAWLLLEDYFEKLSLSRKDFADGDWWPRMLANHGQNRLEELAFLFLRTGRSLPSELAPFANYQRLAERDQAEREQQYLRILEQWLIPPPPEHLDAPRATLRLLCSVTPLADTPYLHELRLFLNLYRPRSGVKNRQLGEILELSTRNQTERELFSQDDWQLVQWIAGQHGQENPESEYLKLQGASLLLWLVQWGHTRRLEQADHPEPLQFFGEMAEVTPLVQENDQHLWLHHQIKLSDGRQLPLSDARFFAGHPRLLLVGHRFYLMRNPPPAELLEFWSSQAGIPITKLGARLRLHLRRQDVHGAINWDEICITHRARPRFVFELQGDTVRLQLLAISERDGSQWHWTGQEWQPLNHADNGNGSTPSSSATHPQVLEDPRLDAATQWLRRLDWFTPEPGLWVGDANETFLGTLAAIWPSRPKEAEYLGNPAFQRLFIQPKLLRPKLIVKGSGIDWLSVSAEWEAEGMRLTRADLERLAAATSRFVKLPDAGWVELNTEALAQAHEVMADLGLEDLSPIEQKVGLEQAAHLDPAELGRFADTPEMRTLRQRLANFKGIPSVPLPPNVKAELRPYQKEGFDFLCHLTRLKLGGILADDMGLGKTLQTLAWLAWLKHEHHKNPKPSLVICPASVLHNWRREAEKFVPDMRVLVLESGQARHNLRKQIPHYDLIVTNYALLRRDLAELAKFSFRAVILDEAQFIKNPTAQVTQSVKELKADQRLALTGTPLENRLLDLWSITDFIQPGYLGTQEHFHELYEPKVSGDGEEALTQLRIARRRLSARLRPIMIRRLKQQVAKDLPDRIEERRDCELGEQQRKLYLAELRRSREQISQIVAEKGLNKSKMHVLAALTRLRQICCHPALVGNDSPSGKTETLFELLEPLLAQNHKVLLFSQFVQMLRLLEKECQQRGIPTHILTGETKERQAVVQAFQNDPKASVFLLSLRAAGTGLNLTTASYVILYDPWWNPAVEAQAIDRSHRIGQTRTVNAYRLISPGTVEEKIWDLQQRKAQTIADVLGEEGFTRSLTQADLEYLFRED